MILQNILLALIITGALWFLVQRLRLTFATEKSACVGDCGCAKKELTASRK